MNILGDCNSEQPVEPTPGRGPSAQPLPGVAPGAATQGPAATARPARPAPQGLGPAGDYEMEVERGGKATPVPL